MPHPLTPKRTIPRWVFYLSTTLAGAGVLSFIVTLRTTPLTHLSVAALALLVLTATVATIPRYSRIGLWGALMCYMYLLVPTTIHTMVDHAAPELFLFGNLGAIAAASGFIIALTLLHRQSEKTALPIRAQVTGLALAPLLPFSAALVCLFADTIGETIATVLLHHTDVVILVLIAGSFLAALGRAVWQNRTSK